MLGTWNNLRGGVDEKFQVRSACAGLGGFPPLFRNDADGVCILAVLIMARWHLVCSKKAVITEV